MYFCLAKLASFCAAAVTDFTPPLTHHKANVSDDGPKTLQQKTWKEKSIVTMKHGYEQRGQIVQPPYLSTVGLTSTGRPYYFQGTMKEIKAYMEGAGSTIGLRVKCDADYSSHNWSYLVVDIYDVAPSAAEQFRKAVVSAIPIVNILGALVTAGGNKRVQMKLRYGFTAQPETSSHVRIHIELPEEGSCLGYLAAALNGDRNVSGLKVANVALAVTKTVLKIMAKGFSVA